MQFFWIGDKIAQEIYALSWHQGHENLTNYQKQAPCWFTPCSSKTLVLTLKKIPQGIIKGGKT
jgi:hypothetical protein